MGIFLRHESYFVLTAVRIQEISNIIPEASYCIAISHMLGLHTASPRAIDRSKANSPRISASIVTSCGFASRQAPHLFLSVTTSRTALGPSQSLIQWVPRVLPPGVKRTGRAAHHVTLPRLCLHLPLTVACLTKHRKSITSHFTR